MKLPRVAAVCAGTALITLLACSEDDTIVALNVTSSTDVGEVSRLNVKLTQGETEFVYDIEDPPHDDADGMAGDAIRIKDRFYERITLPDSFKTGSTRIDVEAYDAGGSLTLTAAPVFVKVREQETVAATVAFDRPDAPEPPPPPPEGGAGGMAGDAGAPSTGGTGGTGGVGGTGGTGGTIVGEGGSGGAAEAGAGGAEEIAGAGGAGGSS